MISLSRLFIPPRLSDEHIRCASANVGVPPRPMHMRAPPLTPSHLLVCRRGWIVSTVARSTRPAFPACMRPCLPWDHRVSTTPQIAYCGVAGHALILLVCCVAACVVVWCVLCVAGHAQRGRQHDQPRVIAADTHAGCSHLKFKPTKLSDTTCKHVMECGTTCHELLILPHTPCGYARAASNVDVPEHV